MNVTASIDGLALIASGTALIANSELRLMIDDLPVLISFISDSGTPRWETEGRAGHGVTFKLFNMSKSNGEGVFTPISIAKSEEVEYFVSFYVTTLNNGTKRVFVYNILEKRAES